MADDGSGRTASVVVASLSAEPSASSALPARFTGIARGKRATAPAAGARTLGPSLCVHSDRKAEGEGAVAHPGLAAQTDIQRLAASPSHTIHFSKNPESLSAENKTFPSTRNAAVPLQKVSPPSK